MALGQECVHLIRHLVHLVSARDVQDHVTELVVAGEPSHGGGDRHENELVKIIPVQAPLRFHHSDDDEPVVPDLDFAPQRGSGTEQLDGDILAEHDDPPPFINILLHEKSAAGWVKIAHLTEVRGGPCHLPAEVTLVRLEVTAELEYRRDADVGSERVDREGVSIPQTG